MEATLRHHLTTLANAYASALGIPVSTTSRRATGDGRFLQRVNEENCSFTIRKYDEAILWFSSNWPKNTPWPNNVPRPTTSTEARPETADIGAE